MKLYTSCKHCNAEIPVKASVSDRGEFARRKGDWILLQCEECLRKNRYHANEIKAKESQWLAVIASGILFMGTAFLGSLFLPYTLSADGIAVVIMALKLMIFPSIVYVLLLRQERANVSRFNSYWT